MAVFDFRSYAVYLDEECQWLGVLMRAGQLEDVVVLPDAQALGLYLRDPWNKHLEGYLTGDYDWLHSYIRCHKTPSERDVIISVVWPRNALDAKAIAWPDNRPD